MRYQFFKAGLLLLTMFMPCLYGLSELQAEAVQASKSRTITGTVISSEDKLPVIGANVWLKNSSTGTITDFDGNYSITVDGIGGVLVFSYLGSKTQEIAIGDQNVVNVTLSPETEVLDEVVVVGYGHQKKESVVGAISTVDVNRLQVQSSSLSTALAGQLSGVVALNKSGEPGKDGAANFYIRGVSSFTGNTKPLVLVDGIERDIDLVSLDDIESFSILKDAAASAVYGVRGANGVILITTRKGKEGKPKINARVEAGITSPTKMPEFVNSAQWAELYNEASGTKFYSESDIEKYRTNADPDLYPNVNWLDALYKNNAYNQRANVDISGGGDICKYYVSGGFYNESSIFKNAGNLYNYDSSLHYNKFSFRANMDFSLTKTTTLTVNLANIYEKSTMPGTDKGEIWKHAFEVSPNAYPIEYSDGTIAGPLTQGSPSTPWNMLVHTGYKEQAWNSAQSLIGIKQDLSMITEGLSANVKFSWDAWNTSIQSWTKSPTEYHASGRDESGNLIYGDAVNKGSKFLSYNGVEGAGGNMVTYLEASLNYSRLFNQKHRVGGLFLYNHKIKKVTQTPDREKALVYKDQGIAARFTYAFKDTYFAEFNCGYNGSENFARGHRFGFFPAGAVGWMVSNEKWFEPMTKIFTSLKLRGSYGLVGNDDIGGGRRWVYQPTIVSSGNFKYGVTGNYGGSGIRIGEVENLSASWEKAYKADAGIEMRLFDRVRLQADYFHEVRQGIFVQRGTVPLYMGVSTMPYINIGETLNQGIDSNIEYDQKIGDVFVTARGNFTFTRNKLINKDEPDYEYPYQNRTGKPFGTGGSRMFGLIAEGLFETEEEVANSPQQMFGTYGVGDIKYRDVNGDGVINDYDEVAIGYTNLPEITYGFGATAQWKGFDFNFLFQGVARTSFYIEGRSITSVFNTNKMEEAAIQSDVYYNVWKSTNTPEQNANAIYPRMHVGAGNENNAHKSSWWVRDGSFLRLKNVEIGYTFPKTIMQKTFMKSLRVYLSGTNLLTFSKFNLWDPEKGGGDGSGYPPNKIVSLGFKVTL